MSRKYKFHEKEVAYFISFVTVKLDRYIYPLIRALIASKAYAVHLGCLSLDPTIIGGALCHSAAVIGQVAANYIASEDYIDCLENQKNKTK
jgi:hypothetical protein